MTTPEQLRAIVRYLQDRVQIAADGGRAIAFDPPTDEEMAAAGLDEATVRRLLAAPWWQEMIDDIVETPEFTEPDETPGVVLGYARDVVQEYLRKRFTIES